MRAFCRRKKPCCLYVTLTLIVQQIRFVIPGVCSKWRMPLTLIVRYPLFADVTRRFRAVESRGYLSLRFPSIKSIVRSLSGMKPIR